MILPVKCRCRSFGFLAAMTLLFLTPARAETERNAAPVAHTAGQQAMLQALDNELTRFEVLLTEDENVSHAATVRATFVVLKQRRDAFSRLAFDQSKYDELRFDLNVAYQRLNLWLAHSVAPRSTPKTSAADSAQHKKAGA